ncbi:MAG TPA: UrcA family protein [Rhizomicrobium sp.]|nr:UrcA family protein [Rhizomicrobium sp.]
MPLFSKSLLAGTGALGLLLTTAPVFAQDYDGLATERVEVIAPNHHHADRSSTGAPIVDVALTREVRFDDLDLSTPRGAHILRARIRNTAQELCSKLDLRYPVATSDSPPCYRTAVSDAMDQADTAIAQARR